MIHIAFPSAILTPSVNIEDISDSVVSSWTMSFNTTEANGMSWYLYSFNWTPWADYHIQVDGGPTLLDPEVRYVDEWVTEEWSSAWITVADIEASTILAKTSDIPSASTIASAVRTNLTVELARLDAAISTRMATFTYTAPDNASITAVKAKTDQLLFTATNLHTVAKVVEDKTGYALTSGERTAIATAVEASLLNEWDGQAILNAIVWAIGNTNISQVALVAAIRADIERTGGMLDLVPTDILLSTDTRLDHLDANISSRSVPWDVSIQLTSSPNATVPIWIIIW